MTTEWPLEENMSDTKSIHLFKGKGLTWYTESHQYLETGLEQDNVCLCCAQTKSVTTESVRWISLHQVILWTQNRQNILAQSCQEFEQYSLIGIAIRLYKWSKF